MSAGTGSPAALFEMLLAYKTTAVLRTGIELAVFDALADGPATAAELAQRLELAERGVRLLLNGLSALGLLEYDDRGRFGLTGTTAAHLVRGRPGFVGDMAKVLASRWEWEALGALTAAVRAGGPVVADHAETPRYQYWEQFAAYAGAVAGPAAEFAAGCLEPWAGDRGRLEVLDVACGHGIYGYTLARRYPEARVCSLDWPNVLPVARKHAADLGVVDRVSTIAGDMFEVPLGGPYDVVMLTNVLHHFSPERGAELLRRVAGALAEDGRLVVVGFVSRGGPPHEDAAAHLFSVLMLVWTAAGEVHTEQTYQWMLRAAGLRRRLLRQVPSLPLSVMVAEKSPDPLPPAGGAP
jgi:C-methyltransferase